MKTSSGIWRRLTRAPERDGRRVTTTQDARADKRLGLKPEQMAALKEFDQAVNAASAAEVLGLIVPAVLGPRCGGGLRLRGCSREQLRALMDLKKGYERELGRAAVGARRGARREKR
jgi:hypothetical protein